MSSVHSHDDLTRLKFLRVKFYEENQQDVFLNTSLGSFSRLAFATTMTNVIDANKRHKDSFSHKVCKEYLLTISIVMYFSKDFYLVETINKKIGQFISSGIMSHLINRYVDMKYWNVKTLDSGPQKLSYEHLEGAFVLWMLFLMLSLVVFLLELLIRHNYM